MNASEVQDSGNGATLYVDDWTPGPIWWWAELSPTARTPSGLIAEALRNRAIQTSRTEAAIMYEMPADEIEALGARQR